MSTERWTREEYLAFFQESTARMLATTKAKNHDYGGANDPFKNFRKHGAFGIMVRMSDKMARLETAICEKRELAVKDETVDDTAFDLATYSLLLVAYLRGSGESLDALIDKITPENLNLG